MWKMSRKWLSFQGEGSFRLSMLKGIFPQKYKEVFGRFCIWKGQDSAHGNEGPGQGRELPRPGRACAATLDFRLPWPLLTECRQCPQGGAESAEQEGSGPAPAPLPGPSYLAPGASTGGLLGLSVRLSSVQFSRSVVSDSLWPHESHHARPPCPSPTPRVYSDSCPSSWWCHPAISSSVIPFSSCPQSLPASGSFPTSQLFAWVL